MHMEEEMMKERIERVTELEVNIVETNEHYYTRYSADDWSIRRGGSDESHYDCEEIEGLFQTWLKENSEDKSHIKWDETPIDPNEDSNYTHIQGFTNSHFWYRVEWKGWKDDPGYVLYLFSSKWSSLNEWLYYEDTLEEIKRIAEAHYSTIMMKERIERVTELEVNIVETNEHYYTRYSADDWSIRRGGSDESHYDCEEIEGLFQTWLKENSGDKSHIKWDETPIDPNEDSNYTHIQGFTNSHFWYRVEWKGWKDDPGYVLYLFSSKWSSLNEWLYCKDTLEEIKRIAEAHYSTI